MRKKKIFKLLTVATAMLLLVGCKDIKDKVADKKESQTTEIAQVEQGSVQTWSIDKYPNYYTVVGKSGINPSDFPEAGKIQYGELEANHDGALYYGAKPVYEGNELVPRYVEVSMKSSDGTIDEKVIVFNSANGFEINYADGTFKAIE